MATQRFPAPPTRNPPMTSRPRQKRAPHAAGGERRRPTCAARHPQVPQPAALRHGRESLRDARRHPPAGRRTHRLRRARPQVAAGHHAQHPAAGDRRAGRRRRVADEPRLPVAGDPQLRQRPAGFRRPLSRRKHPAICARAARPARSLQERRRYRPARDRHQCGAEELPALEDTAGRSVRRLPRPFSRDDKD